MEMTPLFGLLRALAHVLWPEIRKLHAERRAAQTPSPIRPENDSLDRYLEDALARLGSIDTNQEFWQKLLAGIGAAYMRPEYFEFPQVRRWLSDDQVKIDFKNLARDRFIGKNVDNNTLDRLRKKYTEETSANVHGATYAITVVLAVLHASIRAVLRPSENIVADIIKDAHADNVEKISEQSQKMEGVERELRRLSPAEDALHGEVLRKELERITNRRATPGSDLSSEIEALLVRVRDGGDLSRAPMSDKAETYYWAARILASDEKKFGQAKGYLDSYKKILPHYDPSKAAYIEAWLHEAAGRIQDAIKILSALDTGDARTSLLILLAKRDGNASALDWLADNEPYAHTLLSPAGWRNTAGMMAEEGRWQEAIDLLDNLPEEMFTSFPDLFFVKGLLHASFLLPEPVRPKLFEQSYINFTDAQEGDAATEHRMQAVQAFQQAHERLLELGAEERAHGCEYHLMWIRLTDSQQHNTALVELRNKMQDERYAPFMLDIALNFDIAFDQEPLRRYLRRRQREGRQEPQDQVAQFRLLQHFGEPTDILAYLDEAANALKEIIPPTALASTKIHAFVEDGRIANAEKELEGCVAIFSEEDYERHRLMIAGRKGEELKQLETLYKQTGQYQDLANLVQYLERTQQWEALLPYARELLAARRAAVCLQTVIRAVQQTGASDEDIVACLDEYQDLIVPHTPEGDELLFYRGLALFGLGRFAEAREIITDVAENSHAPNAISLEINIALRTGQWEHFTSIVDREFSRLQELPAQLLLQMASVVADWDQDRAMKIVHIAAEKEPETGEIQANAYWLAARIGRDMDATTSLERMIRLAQQGKGPMRPVTLQEIVETLPTHAEQRREWEQKYITGEISLHQAAASLNMPVAQLLAGEFLRNENETDPRRRTVIPIRHGGRGSVKLPDIHNLSFDLSSLLVLETLGVLEAAFNAVEKVYLSPRLMDALFIEQQRVRFHQPSRVEEAKRILKLINDGISSYRLN